VEAEDEVPGPTGTIGASGRRGDVNVLGLHLRHVNGKHAVGVPGLDVINGDIRRQTETVDWLTENGSGSIFRDRPIDPVAFPSGFF
jgi:hypothetical protein